jgi:hypothetical protein
MMVSFCLAACHCNGSSSAPEIAVALSLVAGWGPRPSEKEKAPLTHGGEAYCARIYKFAMDSRREQFKLG